MLRSPVAIYEDEAMSYRIETSLHDIDIHRTATIGQDVEIGRNVSVGPFAIIDDGAEIGDNVKIGAHVYIGPLACIGANSILHPHVAVRDRVRIGQDVIINCGSIIGSDGFGFTNNSGINHKVPQVGTVEVEDNVWIGSNVTIDRATIGTTRIRRGARLDNLVQVGHNVEVGENTVVMPQVGIAGSTVIGANCYIGEKVGITGHIRIGDNVRVHPFSGINKGLKDGEHVMGVPARPAEMEGYLQSLVGGLPAIVKDIQHIKRRLNSEIH
jgi:UDP-3-O-[3-hydroxymyristoyl] glucosamine N-acyltransferase